MLTNLTEITEINGCLVRHTRDHRLAQVVSPNGNVYEFQTNKRFTGVYQAKTMIQKMFPQQSEPSKMGKSNVNEQQSEVSASSDQNRLCATIPQE